MGLGFLFGVQQFYKEYHNKHCAGYKHQDTLFLVISPGAVLYECEK